MLAEDEELTLAELLYDYVKTPKVRLAVLSACQSAITDFGELSDEYVGLPVGLMQAGIPGVVGTLWPVDDYTTALLMSKFYELHFTGDPSINLLPMQPAGALCQAQRWLKGVTAREIIEYLDDHPSLDNTVRGHVGKDPRGAVLRIARGLQTGPDSPVFDADPVLWAPFIFVGA